MSDTTTVTEYPPCDLCAQTGKQAEARYDAKTTSGPWAYLCETHWRRIGVGKLGTGYGQRLVVKSLGDVVAEGLDLAPPIDR